MGAADTDPAREIVGGCPGLSMPCRQREFMFGILISPSCAYKEVSALHIRVDTDNKGIVTLSEKAKSQAEADKAVSIARGVEGLSRSRTTSKSSPTGRRAGVRYLAGECMGPGQSAARGPLT